MTNERSPQEQLPEGQSLASILERLDALEKFFKHGQKQHLTPPAPTSITTATVAASAGTNQAPANADHAHGTTAPAAGYPVNVVFDSESDGVATTAARSDHRHQITSPDADPAAIDLGDAAGRGSSTTPSRADHQHAITASSLTPNGVTGVTAGAAGTSAIASRQDHRHVLDAPANNPGTIAAAGSVGTGSRPAAADDHAHAHGTGYLPDAHHTQDHGNSDHDAVAWTNFDVTSVTQAGSRAFTETTARHCIQGKLAHVSIRLEIDAVGSAGTEIAVNLPAALTAARSDELAGTAFYFRSGTGVYHGGAYWRSTTSIVIVVDVNANALGQTPSFATSASDILWLHLHYELA